MFDTELSVIGTHAGECTEEIETELAAEDQLGYEAACREMAADDWTEPDRHVLPADLESIPPGLFLAAIVSTVDPKKLSGHDVVRLMQAHARLASHHEAGKLEAMSEVAFSPPGDSDSGVLRSTEQIEDAAAEIAAALTLTRRHSKSELDRAISLSHRLWRVGKALSEGRIDLTKAKVFDQTLGHLPEDTVNTVLDRVLDDASELTTGQLRACLDRYVMEADPDGAASSYEEGLVDRKVTTSSNPDHTANYNIYSGAPDDVAAARANVETIARRLRAREDEIRTLDQIRNDVSLDLLQGKCVHPDHTTNTGGGRVHIHSSLDTLAGLSDTPGEYGGFGPVIAEMARKTVFENVDGEWTFSVTDNGRPVSTGTLARRPTEGMQRYLRARYPKCTWPGCRQDAWDCDLDHRLEWHKAGQTCPHNLGPLCRHHHEIKTRGHWKLDRLPDGDHKWTSPLGHTYITKRGPPR